MLLSQQLMLVSPSEVALYIIISKSADIRPKTDMDPENEGLVSSLKGANFRFRLLGLRPKTSSSRLTGRRWLMTGYAMAH